MNEKIDEIDNLIANGIVGSRIPEEKEEDATDFRTPEELKAIEEAKRTKVTEAVQASTVYNNLANIPGINTKDLLVTMVEMYMELDSKALGNPEYIDLESLNIIINSVKEHEVDSKENGIVTNEDGTINKIESARQLSDMSGVPVSDILVHNKVGALTSDVRLFQNDIVKSEKVFEALVNVYGKDKDNNIKFSTAQSKYMELLKYYETLEKYSNKNVNKKDKFRFNKEEELNCVFLCYAYEKGLVTEKEYIKFIKENTSIKGNSELLNDTSRSIEKNDVKGALQVSEEFVKKYNEGKNKNDLAAYLAKDGKLNFDKISRSGQINVLTDVYIAVASGDEERIEIAKHVLKDIKKRGQHIVDSNIEEINEEQVLELMNEHLTVHGKKVYTKDSDSLKNLIKRRTLNEDNYMEKINQIRENIQAQKKYGIYEEDQNNDFSDTLETSKEKREMLEDISNSIEQIPNMKRNIIDYLEKIEVKSKDCANALAIEGLYLKLCEEEYALTNGKYPETLEEKKDAYKNVYKNSNAGIVYEYMQKYPGIYGDFSKNIEQMKISQIENMLDENKLKDTEGNITVNELYGNIEYAKNEGIKEDFEICYNKAIINECSDILREYGKDFKGDKTKKDLEKIENAKKTIKNSLKKLPTKSIVSQSTLDRLTKGFDEATKIEFLDYMYKVVEEKEKSENKPKKENAFERIRKARKTKELVDKRKDFVSDVVVGKREVVPNNRILKITYAKDSEEVRAEINKVKEKVRKEFAPRLEDNKTSEKNKNETQTKNELESAKQQETTQDLVNTKPKEVEKQTENRFFKFVKDAFDIAGKMGEKIVEGSQNAFDSIGKFTTRLSDRIQGTGDFAPGMKENKKEEKDQSKKGKATQAKDDTEAQKPAQEIDTVPRESDVYRMPENQMDSLIVELRPEQMDARYLANHGKETQSKSVLKTTTKDDRSAEDAIVGNDDEQK